MTENYIKNSWICNNRFSFRYSIIGESKMRVCIAGADCFIGFPLVHRFASENNDVVALVRVGNKDYKGFADNKNIKVIELDFVDYDRLGEVVGPVDCLIVLTWIGTRGHARLDEQLQLNNYKMIYSAIKSTIHYGCKKVLTAGSQAEYGICSGLIDENTVCNPNTAYGKYKVQLYKDVQKLCSQKKVVFIEPRFFSLYGPGDSSETLIMSTIKKMKDSKECNFTESTQMWDYLYIDDAVDAIVKLSTFGSSSGAYNFGSGDRRQLKEYIEEIKSILNSSSKLNYGAIPYGPSGAVSIEPDIRKLKGAISWSPKFTFERGIKATIKSLEKESK